MNDPSCTFIFYEGTDAWCGISGCICDTEDCPGYEDLRVRRKEEE